MRVITDFNNIQTIIIMCGSVLVSIFNWRVIDFQIKYYSEKALRKSLYYRKKWIAKIFLLGAEYLTTKLNVVVNYIDKISSIILIVFCVLNLIWGLKIFSVMMIAFCAIQLISLTIIGLENEVYKKSK